MLTSVEVAVRESIELSAFESDTGVISSFLGPSPNLSLSDACTFGSIMLLDWIWSASCTSIDDSTTGWSLCNHLRSNPHYYAWQFTKALAAAASRGDVRTAEWIVDHFSDCEAGIEVAEAAAENGHLCFLEYLLSLGGSGDVVVHWGGHDMRKAAHNGHSHVVRWLFKYTAAANASRDLNWVIKMTLWSGNVALAESLAPPDRDLSSYTLDCPNREFIEKMLARDDMQDSEYLDDAMGNAARIGDLELLKRVVKMRPPERRGWYCALDWAAKRCDLPMLQWLMQQPACRQLFHQTVKNRGSDLFLLAPAEKGSYEVLQYLYEKGAQDDFGKALIRAVGTNRLDSVKWLLQHYSYDSGCDGRSAMTEAAKSGHISMLNFFQTMNARDSTHSRPEWWAPSRFAIAMAAKNSHLAAIEWLDANRSEPSTTFAMDYAAESGHLDIVKWLHANRSEGCTEYAIGMATRNGHLGVVNWLRQHYPQFTPEQFGVTGHEPKLFDILLFLHKHYPAMFTPKFVRQLPRQGNIGKWIQANFSQQ